MLGVGVFLTVRALRRAVEALGSPATGDGLFKFRPVRPGEGGGGEMVPPPGPCLRRTALRNASL